ncbi:Bacterial ribosome SSU maturation protein RimP [hydrothermal vent metagenome]|uniref:Bacterial ribosome SSU maturation protein RimP n=1 Tax=hydrothermal vent metagenome TaxID=652676 RepID=A0A3B1CA73_9ZZZZ
MSLGDAESLWSIIKPVVEGEALELVDIEITGRGKTPVLRIYIDKDGGVTVEDCAKVSQQAELALTAENFMNGSYTLEVSSPGLTRPLKKPADFKRAVGSLACLVLKNMVAGVDSGKALGVITGANDAGVTFELKDGGKSVEIPYPDIKKANLEIEF